jgi:3-phenylpropionate/trans-cinnamate dioxygenase ferredoxin reductase subunit
MPSDPRTCVIAGAGLAGAKAAQTLREEGFDGRIVMIGAERERPYERPSLSKDYLRGDTPEPAFVHDAGYYAGHGIEVRLGRRAVGLDPAGREIELDTGERLAYDRLLLATGARPRRLGIPGAGLAGVHLLRTIADSDALRARLAPGARIVVVGAGWIGAEVTASARARGVEVTMVAPEAVPLERVLGTEVGGILRDVHLEHGVQMRLGTALESFEGDGTVRRVRTRDGRAIDCDAVVVGIGASPRTELAVAGGLAVDGGVLVDGRLQTSAPGVFAAGDVAHHLHPRLGRLRVEHWDNAIRQGSAAARAMLGASEPYDRTPSFFSDQYDLGMEYFGHAPGWEQVVLRGDPASRAFVALWLARGRVLAGMHVNVWEAAAPIQALIADGRPVDEEIELAVTRSG